MKGAVLQTGSVQGWNTTEFTTSHDGHAQLAVLINSGEAILPARTGTSWKPASKRRIMKS